MTGHDFFVDEAFQTWVSATALFLGNF